MMRRLAHSLSVGISFGVTSGIITTIGLLVGLSAGTESRTAVLAGILTIAVADSLSDALGIHISEENEGVHTSREVWGATAATFGSKLIMALTFVVPVLLFPLDTAVIVAIVWGAISLTALSIAVGRRQGIDPRPIVLEHLGVATLVVVAAHLLGLSVSALLG
jgi:VIT1/CCC1 family predicted Fe2+/Mn2+ transporter